MRCDSEHAEDSGDHVPPPVLAVEGQEHAEAEAHGHDAGDALRDCDDLPRRPEEKEEHGRGKREAVAGAPAGELHEEGGGHHDKRHPGQPEGQVVADPEKLCERRVDRQQGDGEQILPWGRFEERVRQGLGREPMEVVPLVTAGGDPLASTPTKMTLASAAAAKTSQGRPT